MSSATASSYEKVGGKGQAFNLTAECPQHTAGLKKGVTQV